MFWGSTGKARSMQLSKKQTRQDNASVLKKELNFTQKLMDNSMLKCSVFNLRYWKLYKSD